MLLTKSYGKHNTFTVFIGKKNPRFSGPTQFKPVLFKGQLQYHKKYKFGNEEISRKWHGVGTLD